MLATCRPENKEAEDLHQGSIANLHAGLTRLSKLTSLGLRSNGIDDDSGFEAAAPVLAAVPKLVELELRYNNTTGCMGGTDPAMARWST